MEIKHNCYKGTRILFCDTAKKKREIINRFISIAENYGYQEMMLPIIQFRETFNGKVGEENNNLMYNFKDRGDRDICLAPEYTAVVQKLALEYFKFQKDVKLFYVQECFRGENPQRGRYRQFTQFGVEVLNPTEDYKKELCAMAFEMTMWEGLSITVEFKENVTRGLDYYNSGMGLKQLSKN